MVEIVQLDVPHTYTRACNIGLEIAKERGCDYLFVANNDIVFRTDVARELIAEMASDPDLGIVAPTQVIIDDQTGKQHLAYRVFWDLGSMRFEHDFNPPPASAHRLESDFCELTLALVRISAAEEIGFLDDDYGFYFEDADFGFRLRQGGYVCAYLARSQIDHYHSSTFRKESHERKTRYMARNKELFRSKHLGLGVRHADHRSDEASSWNVINVYLHRYIRKFGMLDDKRPELIFSHPGVEPFDYLYSVWGNDQASRIMDRAQGRPTNCSWHRPAGSRTRSGWRAFRKSAMCLTASKPTFSSPGARANATRKR